MKANSIKKNPTIGCCGIDCCLCPRYHTEGKSRCPGCAGKDFFEKHPSCSLLTCCFKTRNMETCGNCEEFICKKVSNWDSADSFVTHRTCITNLKNIREGGLAAFILQQGKRLRLLETLLAHYDDGRSKSFYCLAAALLPIEEIKIVIESTRSRFDAATDRKHIAKSIREAFTEIASRSNIALSYRKKI